MKTRSIILMSFLLIASAFTLHAQNALPDPHDSSCWQSLESLRACQLDQYNRELKYEQNCTSYPEYQCNPSTTDTTPDSELAKTTPTTKTNLKSTKQLSPMTSLTPTTSTPNQTANSK